ncbi:RIP domain-containing protein [Cephalotus follicularis]|uniref:rRNA N-glycosylase n=1 Tax=Cephalotus follicularis TaxID=3775 RepID=A0A1Q3BTG0_CEPFO|nr:RIP domain-containing protein [Cephalotus follicularis]
MDKEFELEFNVETSTKKEDYERFIVQLRNRLGRDQRRSHDRPILPSHGESGTIRWFHIVLRTSSASVTLRFRYSNLYLYGFQRGDSWHELGDENLINEATELTFGVNYQSLLAAAHLDDLQDIDLSWQALQGAVYRLAQGGTNEQLAKALIVVIFMFCESTRFTSISNHLTRTYMPSNSSARITTWMERLAHSWSYLSMALLDEDANPELRYNIIGDIPLPPELVSSGSAPPPPPSETDEEKKRREEKANTIRTVLQASSILAIVYCRGPGPSRRFSRDATIYGQCSLARALTEVLSVRVHNKNGSGKVYGTIIVTDALGFQYIYNRTKRDPEALTNDEDAMLTGPARPISAYGSFNFKAVLTDKHWWSSDDEISNGRFWWEFTDTTNEYDKPLSRAIDGKDGSLTVNYIVFRDAVAVSLRVEVIEGSRYKNVYGELTATNSNFGESSDHKIVLFKRSLDSRQHFNPGQLVPLSRSVVAVPFSSSLILTANLSTHHEREDLRSGVDSEIANGTATFVAQPSGTSERIISGKEGDTVETSGSGDY